ncbi:related to Nucleolar protein 4 [Saccharomycodes ludwigii]|uniref:Related to Nucleolar protein 4 n=1 Tax=Saccharomycodes ludwigii TaxID=36035 RepID=A0A376B1Q5_9ASCO|nr:hypothetical protein SCDLUD_001956 [Saccharomycodes ludwigii]KAH3902143.1 hypothetical protein SCDLUD_001956 [Saccharomycodes ludwigii]SSD58597.1 related to Nucleolar protein 4 [Saccharomycodes ludwigii]
MSSLPNNKNAILDTSKKLDPLDRKTLFVRSIPVEATDEELSNFFSQFAPIRHAVIVKNENNESRRFGFVTFADDEDAKQALEKSRKVTFKKGLLKIDIAKRRERKQPVTSDSKRAGANEDNPQNKNTVDDGFKGKPKLIIRNMPWSCRDPNKLKKIFTRFGIVEDAYIPRKTGGKMSGFAFVTMKKIVSCRKAVEGCKDLKIDGRTVAVDFAVDKNRWEHNKEKENQDEEEEEEEEGEEDDDDDDNEEEDDDDDDDEKEDDDNDDEDLKDIPEVKEEEAKRPKKNTKERFSVFVRNVPYDATEDSLSSHFSKFGAVKYALPVIDKETGLPKGTAFVAFRDEVSYKKCIDKAPSTNITSLLISDDVAPEYVYEGRVLSITPTLDRDTANRVSEKKALHRKEMLGKAPSEKDRRNLYLLNEGRINENSKLAQVLSPSDLEIREKSYQLRVQQLKTNPSLHLSLTRLAIRNIPRSMTEKALKALARKAVVQFATEIKEGKRHELSKEEIDRSTREKYRFMTLKEIEQSKANKSKKNKKQGLVKQAKIIMEVKGSTIGRSRGYGFVEYKDHKSALMGLRWLNAHEVTKQEIFEGLTPEEKKSLDTEGFSKRRLVVEFAVENATVIKRRKEKYQQFLKKKELESKEGEKRNHDNEDDDDGQLLKKKQKINHQNVKLNEMEKNKTYGESTKLNNTKLTDDVKRIISMKRKRRRNKN